MTARDRDGGRLSAPPSADPAPEPSDERTARALKTWVVLARAYAAVARAVEGQIARHGLTTTEFGILEALHHKGPLLLGEIQRKVLVTSGGITYLVDRLVAKGLVTRVPSPDDRRARYAVLTPEGKQLIAEIFPAHAAFLADVLSTLNEREHEEAAALLRKLGRGAAARTEAPR
ncbi:MAG: MarR family transcriptional regulator [Gemmatimonadaceae bacterium]|nr:MarR family transcriptional regulator [Gemmatimonadaceae bacterium]NUP57187.1 MarR family transcriptional regulator [Gemmatimonadaceae bacterium]